KARKRTGLPGTVLVGLTPAVREVLSLTGLLAFWRQALSREEGVALVAPPDGSAASGAAQTPASQHSLVHWQDAGGVAASLAELAVAFGRGGLGTRRAEALSRPARFASIGQQLCMAFDDGERDTWPVADPQQRFLRLQEAWSFRGEPQPLPPLAATVTLDELVPTLRAAAGNHAGWLGVAALLPATGNASAGLLLAALGPQPPAFHDMAVIPLLPVTAAQGDTAPANWGALLEQLPDRIDEGLLPTPPTTLPQGARLWVWHAAAPTPATEASLQVQLPTDKTAAPDETELLVRSLYADCRQVTLSPLAGGFSATTWLVDSRDAQGRRQLPTVLKVGPPAMMTREDAAHERYVRPFILNNASIGMGRAQHGDAVGLRYNFVGVTGDMQGLRTLQRRWLDGDTAAVTRLYGEAARQTLLPWYGQARDAAPCLFADHSPLRLFPFLPTLAREVLGDLMDAPTLPCPPLGRDLPNPWRYLAEVYPRRAAEAIPCKVAITHGDMNLNNLLADERDNLYVIDFSETRERAVGSDFARLEPVFLIERAELADDAAEAAWLQDVADLYDPSRPWHETPFTLRTVPAARRDFIGQLRRLGAHYLGSGAPQEAWLLPVLEWTLPIIFFGNLPLRQRRASTWAAALIVERLSLPSASR
ncbi:MAG: hypothetical protein RL026_2073, partial [Pseudomonadota bacterium]